MEYTLYRQKLLPVIITEANKRFRKYGVKAVKMDDIARSLSISKRTLYELYSTKEDLLVEVLKKGYEDRMSHMKKFSLNCDNTMDLLIEALRSQMENSAKTSDVFYSDVEAYPKAAQMLHDFYDSQKESSSQFFQKGIQEGYFLPYVDFAITDKIISEAMKMIRTNKDFKQLSYKELFMNFLYVLLRGFCTIKGIERIDDFVNRFVKPHNVFNK